MDSLEEGVTKLKNNASPLVYAFFFLYLSTRYTKIETL